MTSRTPHRFLRAALALQTAVALGAAAAARAQGGRADSTDVRDSLAVYEQQIQVQEEHLQELRGQIRDLRKRDQQLKKQEGGTLAQLKILDQEVALTSDLLRQLGRKRGRLEAQLEGIRAEHARAEELLGERKDRLARTLEMVSKSSRAPSISRSSSSRPTTRSTP